MTALLKIIFDIAILRSGPQDIPFSVFLLQVLLVLYFFTGVAVLMSSEEMGRAIGIQVLDVALLFVYFGVCLRLLKKRSRFVQTICAMLAVGCFFHLLMWPIALQYEASVDGEHTSTVISLMSLMLISWYVLVYAHILKLALSVRMASAIGLAVAFLVLSISLEQMLFQVA